MENLNKSASIGWANELIHVEEFNINLNTGLTLKIEVKGFACPEGASPDGNLEISAYDHQGNKFSLLQNTHAVVDPGTAFFKLNTYVGD